MKKLTRILLVKSGITRKPKDQYGYWEGIISIGINLILFGIKYWAGIVSGSIAVKADAFHTLSDVITSVLVIVGFFFALQPPDKKHPFGHGRSEKVATIVMATLLCVIGYEFFISSLNQFLHPAEIQFRVLFVVVFFISILLKEFLYFVSLIMYEESGYEALKADAWHHRSDSLASLIVILGLFFFKAGLVKLDGILGMLIALLIVYTGLVLILEVGSFLLGEAPSPDLEERIQKIVKNIGGQGIHHIHIHDYAGKLEITLHVRMNPNVSLEQVHKKATSIEQAIKAEIPNCEVTVHSEPENLKSNPTKK
ncbi:MAG TPA: cation diffusion facilitator family transporter [Candidatus Ratteibacteria bacterium]|nr:cation diffusion facilitator family transporter [Candidatus Ratteibacteria bacterium]